MVNRLDGGDGNDILIGGDGGDTLIGGAGVDTADFSDLLAFDRFELSAADSAGVMDAPSQFQAGLDADLTRGTAIFYDPGAGSGVTTANAPQTVDTLNTIENLTGTRYGDLLAGDGGANVLNGGEGNDELNGRLGNDTMNGGAGADRAIFSGTRSQYTVTRTGPASVSIVGPDGTDTITGVESFTFGSETFSFDQVVQAATAGDDTLTGTNGPDTIDGLGGNDIITGLGGNDTLIGGDGDDTLTGGDGDDALIGGAGADTINGGAGDDLVSSINLATDGADNANLGEGADRVNFAGGVGQIRLTFTSAEVGDGNANDSSGGLAVRAQAEGSLDDPSGTVARFDDEGITFTAAARQTFDIRDTSGVARGDQFGVAVLGTAGADVLAVGADARAHYFNAGLGNDRVTGGSANDFLVGGEGNDQLSGAGGADNLLGGLGDDVLIGGAGGDRLDGGSGADTASYAASAAAVVVTLGGGAAGGDAADDVLIGIENLIGSDFNDVLVGDAGANRLTGGGGADRLDGGDGADELLGGEGDDVLAGGAGFSDTILGGNGADTVTYAGAARGVIVDLDVQRTTDRVSDDTLDSIENATGTAFDDIFFGSGGDNVLDGGSGGSDDIRGYGGVDTVSYASSERGVIIDLDVQLTSDGLAQDTLQSIENAKGSDFNDIVFGSSIANTMEGGLGADQLNGYGGADVLVGGADADTLFGGADGDRFVFTAMSDSRLGASDRITDFKAAEGDLIDLSAIDANLSIAGDQAFVFVSRFTGQAGEATLVFDASANRSSLLLDLDGDAVADFRLFLDGDVGSTAGFVL